MPRVAAIGICLLVCSGCLHPVRTDSKIRVEGPVSIVLPINNNEKPVVPMAVDGGPLGCEPFVALVDVDGLLLNTGLTGPYSAGDNPIDVFREKLDVAASHPQCVGVVLRINSPGGSVTASDVMRQELNNFRACTGKPVVGCMMDLCCSGAYYVATGCDHLIAHPTTITGGIGVILNLYNFQSTMQLAGVENLSITAEDSPKIDLGYQSGLLGEEDRQILVKLANGFHARFKAVVQQHRPTVNIADKSNFDGRVLSAEEAHQRGLIDQIGYLSQATDLAKQMSNAPTARVAMLHRIGDDARTPFATSPNVPLQANLLPVSLPSVDRSKLPLFLYLWQPDPSLMRMSGQ